MGQGETYRSTLLYACLIAGGEAKLAERLGVTVEDVVRWVFGDEEPPLATFLVAVDIVLKERAGSLAQTKKMLRVSKAMLERTQERQRAYAARRLRVLVVDDEADSVETLTALLVQEGHEASGARDGREALAALEQRPADVAILDIGMPGMNGWALAREMRRALADACPVLVAMTGQYTRGDDKALAGEAGFSHYLYKPCDPKVLLALLARIPGRGSPRKGS